MSRKHIPGHSSPLADELGLLLRTEARLESMLSAARDSARRALAEAQTVADQEAAQRAANAERERRAIRDEYRKRTNDQIDSLKRDAVAQIARYHAVSGISLTRLVDRMCVELSKAVVGRGK